tara:strand:- start:1854 stop:2222 length:369 start_codon:yes stop_codon:yes gene_type:complete
MRNNAKISNVLHKYAKIHFLVQLNNFVAVKKMIIIAETEKMSKLKISRRRHLIKAISWNTLAMITTYIVLTELPPLIGYEPISKDDAGFLVALDRVVKLVFYYIHERTWFASNWGVIKPKDQ